VNIFSMGVMNDSARRSRLRFPSSHTCFLHNCLPTTCPYLATTNLPCAQVVHHLLGGESEAT